MPKPELSEKQINELFYVNQDGFLCRKHIDKPVGLMTNLTFCYWNNHINKPLKSKRLAIKGYKKEKTEFYKDVVLYGLNEAMRLDKEKKRKRMSISAANRNAERKYRNLIFIEKCIRFCCSTKRFLVFAGVYAEAIPSFSNIDDAKKYRDEALKQDISITRDVNKKPIQDEEILSKPEPVDNSDLLGCDYFDNSANNQIGYLSVYG